MAKGDARCLQRAEEQWGVITRKEARRHLSASQVQSKLESGGVDEIGARGDRWLRSGSQFSLCGTRKRGSTSASRGDQVTRIQKSGQHLLQEEAEVDGGQFSLCGTRKERSTSASRGDRVTRVQKSGQRLLQEGSRDRRTSIQHLRHEEVEVDVGVAVDAAAARHPQTEAGGLSQFLHPATALTAQRCARVVEHPRRGERQRQVRAQPRRLRAGPTGARPLPRTAQATKGPDGERDDQGPEQHIHPAWIRLTIHGFNAVFIARHERPHAQPAARFAGRTNEP